MDDITKNLKGSKARDDFRFYHKQSLPKDFYACDGDLVLVHKYPPGTVAYFDFKTTQDQITFSEVIQYNEWMTHAPVYIIESDNPQEGPFTVTRYLGGDWKPDPPTWNPGEVRYCATWTEFEKFERELRDEYHRRDGWKRNLRKRDDVDL